MRNLVLAIVILKVLCVDVKDIESFLHDRAKQQDDDRWSWGTVDNTETIIDLKRKGQPIVSRIEEENPCLVPDPPVPDFSAPGRRLSEVKCYEYIYDIKARDERDRRLSACEEYKLKKLEEMGIPRPVQAIGGRDAEPGEFPHMGAVGWAARVGGWIFKCGGTLISERFVLSAGHCMRASPRDTSIFDVVPKIVRLGDKNIIDVWANDKLPEDYKIFRTIKHPDYDPPRKYIDIALIELERNVTFSRFVQPACLWIGPDDDLVGLRATLTGWGVVETIGKTTSPDLQAAVVDVFDNEVCDRLLKPSCNRHWCGILESQLCAGVLAGGVDACQGDSGGPLQIKISLPASTQVLMYHVIGVTSFGIGCARPNIPGVYTRVSSFVEWIENNVWK